jgi:hypothetical protein
MKLDLNKQLKNLKGEVIENSVTMGELLGDRIAGSNTKDTIKWLHWAISLSNKEPIEVDKSDLIKIKDFVENCQQFNNLIAGRILEEIADQEG